MYGRGWDVGSNVWRWHRYLFAWEKDLVDVLNKWMGHHNPSIGYLEHQYRLNIIVVTHKPIP
ncbi:hypothetical protein TSUD_337570 [Trifolium subterraneum]|uniref:Uncharacterized protein n=1 Tax=Trifolium subterraneum TaxID=3900 RepID=A0A2Z6MD89_TRISU|nr:hypothetical protein TSUD_337570 [Trifolium subterraneum]